MAHLQLPEFLGLLAILFALAKALGFLAQKIGQPAVLGELLAGVLAGASVFGLVNLQNEVDPRTEVLHALAEIGVVILLFEIGLETELQKLMRVGGAAALVAIVGVVVPFGLGYLVCRWLGYAEIVAVVAGASLTATSVGISARVLSDLGRLQEPEGQVVLGAAVLDDIVGLIILTVVAGLVQGEQLSVAGVARITGLAFGFLAATLLVGRFVVRRLFRIGGHIDLPGTATMLAVMLAFSLAWLAHVCGSAMIIGAFAAGLLLAGTPFSKEIERGVGHLGHFFVPLFFLNVGASVDLTTFDARILLVGGVLIVIGVLGKFVAGYAPFWFRGNKAAIGVGMVPRGEVGLIFAQKGLASGVFDLGLFGAVTLMVMVTTFVAPPWLRFLLPAEMPRSPPVDPEGIEDLVTKA